MQREKKREKRRETIETLNTGYLLLNNSWVMPQRVTVSFNYKRSTSLRVTNHVLKSFGLRLMVIWILQVKENKTELLSSCL